MVRKIKETLSEFEKYKKLIENFNDIIFVVNSKGKFILFNKKAEKLLGYNRNEIMGKSFSKILPKKYWIICRNKFKTLSKGEKFTTTEMEFLNKYGKKFPVEIDCIPFFKDNLFFGVQVVARDITKRGKIEQEKTKLLNDLIGRVKELRCIYTFSKLIQKPDISLEKVLEEAVNLLPSAWHYSDIARARIVFENREFKTKNFKKTRWKQSADIKVHGKRVGTVEVYYLKEKPVLNKGPFLKEERDLLDDVAERLGKFIEFKKTEILLKESEEKYRNVFESARDVILTFDLKGNITTINKIITEYGFKKDEMIGKKIFKFVPKKYWPQIFKDFVKMLQGNPVEGELEIITPQRKIFTEYKSNPIRREKKVVGYQTIIRDVSKRKKMEEEIEKRTEELEKFSKLAVGRELKMIELKERIKELEREVKIK